MNKSELKKIIENVMKTTRKITNININGAERKDVISIINIVKKFSTSVVDFKLNGGGRFEVTSSEFIEIMSSIPNVINLSLVRVHFMGPKGTELLPSYEDLNLNQLKMLSIEYCSDEIVSTFNRLPAGFLSELGFRGDNLHQLNDLFKNQIGIKKLILELELDWPSPRFTNKNLFDDLQLESFEWEASTFFDGFYNIKTLLSKQTKLKSLKLKGGKVGEDSIDFITNQFTEVESLSMLISETDLKQIGKLKNLKELTLESNGDSWTNYVSTLESFAGLDNSRITTLNICCMYYITPTQIAALAKSLPNLKFLHYDDYFDAVVQDVMENFTFLEGLEISCALSTTIDYQGNYVNPKLRLLKLNCNIPIDTRILKKLITDYPNLKKLTIKTRERSKGFTVEHFKQILEGFSKMESLCLCADFNALDIKNVLKLLKLHKNIKFIAFAYTHVPIREYAKLRKDLLNMNMFDVVEFSSSTNYSGPVTSVQMAVGKNTFKSEKVVF